MYKKLLLLSLIICGLTQHIALAIPEKEGSSSDDSENAFWQRQRDKYKSPGLIEHLTYQSIDEFNKDRRHMNSLNKNGKQNFELQNNDEFHRHLYGGYMVIIAGALAKLAVEEPLAEAIRTFLKIVP